MASLALTPTQFSEQVVVVLLGSFNPKIFHPEWFLRQKLIGEEMAASAVVTLVSSEVTEVVLGDIHFFCADDRLSMAVSSMVMSETLSDMMVGLLKALPHTPVTAVGINHNFEYQNNSVEEWHRIGDMLAPKEAVWSKLMTSPGMLIVSMYAEVDWRYKVAQQISVSPGSIQSANHPSFKIKANLHFSLPQSSDEVPVATELVISFLEEKWELASTLPSTTCNAIYEALSHDGKHS